MKKFNLFFMSVLLLLGSSIVTSCSDDDDPGDTSLVVGTWVGDDYEHFYNNVTITFNPDGTGSATMDHSGTLYISSRAEFTYKVKGTSVVVSGKRVNASSANGGEVDTYDFNNKYEVQGNYLIVTDGDKWYMMNVKSYRRR